MSSHCIRNSRNITPTTLPFPPSYRDKPLRPRNQIPRPNTINFKREIEADVCHVADPCSGIVGRAWVVAEGGWVMWDPWYDGLVEMRLRLGGVGVGRVSGWALSRHGYGRVRCGRRAAIRRATSTDEGGPVKHVTMHTEVLCLG
ncbi:hypothetical protein P154DRAFT_521968, partial [Amniculicola lignicola CBS 123094]